MNTGTSNNGTGRRIGLIAIAVVGTGACIALWLLGSNDVAPVLPLAVLGAAGVIYAAFMTPKLDSAPPSQPASIGGFLLGLAVGFSLVSASTSGDPDNSWMQWAGALGVLVVALAFSLVSRWLVRGRDHVASPKQSDGHRLELADGERAVWVGSASQPFMLVISGAAVLIGLIVALGGAVGPGLLAAALGSIIGAVFARIRVIVDHTGLTVRYSFLRLPSTHVDLADIDEVSVIDVRPLKWGGWGYRGSLRAFGHAAVVVRRGPGLRLDLTKDRTFVVTVDDPEPAAELISAELQRRGARA